MNLKTRWVGALACALFATTAGAWGPSGHELVGAIADSLIAGTHAAKAVKRILGTETLETAAVWADCAKGVTEKAPFKFIKNSRYSECLPFESPAGEARMVSFVKANLDGCHPAADEEKCHRQYHYADVAVARDGYARTEAGTSDHDVVSAIGAAIKVLQGGTAPAPFKLTSRKNALRILVHYVGDVHQPLHVGAVYLDATGQRVDPDATTLDPSTKTEGGNKTFHGTERLHGEWDSIPTRLTVAHFKADAVALAAAVPATPGPVATWPASWASDTVVASHAAFLGVTFGALDPASKHWPVTEPTDYGSTRADVQKAQLVKAGARLAQLLEAIFP